MQEKITNFSVRPDITIKFDRHTYNWQDLSQAVGYWLSVIESKSYDPRPIGIITAGLSFSSIALKLAIIASGKDYVSVPTWKLDLCKDGTFSQVFISGETFNYPNLDENLSNVRFIKRTDSWATAKELLCTSHSHELNFSFSSNQKHFAYTSGSTGQPKQTSIDSYTESLSILTSIDNYFSVDDYCVFSHNMSHVGVHTTAIFPSLFCAHTISLCDSVTWEEEIDNATHVQYFLTMGQHYRLPKKLRVLTFGGTKLTEEFANYIFENCDVESLVDIYGLTECPPPLAVRYLTSIDDIELPFDWVQAHHIPSVDNQHNLFVVRSDGEFLCTGDSAVLNDNKIILGGRTTGTVRVNGELFDLNKFKSHIEQHINSVHYVVDFKNNEPELLVLPSIQLIAQDYIAKFKVEIKLTVVDFLNTNGGIKYVK